MGEIFQCAAAQVGSEMGLYLLVFLICVLAVSGAYIEGKNSEKVSFPGSLLFEYKTRLLKSQFSEKSFFLLILKRQLSRKLAM